MHRRIVVTGLGAITPVGNDVARSWQAVLAGESGVAPITSFDASAFPVRFSAEVKDFDNLAVVDKKDLRKMDLFIRYGLAAGIEAIADAGLEINDQNRHRIGVIVGSGIGGLPYIQKSCELYTSKGVRRISPFFVPSSIINMVSGHLSIRYGLTGPSFSICSACTTGTHSIGEAARIIRSGDADVMLAGGAEMATSAIGIGGFYAARALSQRNDEPTLASRPWDVDRDGFVLGDGAGVVVLESYAHARARNAHIYAELIGYGVSSDAHHITSPPEDGRGAIACMENALRSAALSGQEIDYINAHGTSTPVGDVSEALAIQSVFGDAAKKIPISSTKSMIGHLLGAAGGVEAIFSILAIRDGAIPPTINLEQQDPECTDFDFVPQEARQKKINISLSNSFGFGGTNATLIFQRLH